MVRSFLSKRRVGILPTFSRCCKWWAKCPPYVPNAPSATAPAHSGLTRPNRISRWIDEYGQSAARSTNPCFTGLPQQYSTWARKSASSRIGAPPVLASNGPPDRLPVCDRTGANSQYRRCQTPAPRLTARRPGVKSVLAVEMTGSRLRARPAYNSNRAYRV